MANNRGRVQAVLPGDPRFVGKTFQDGEVGGAPQYQNEIYARIAELKQSIARDEGESMAPTEEPGAWSDYPSEQAPIASMQQPSEDDERIMQLKQSIAESEAPQPNAFQDLMKGYIATGPAGMLDMMLAGTKGAQDFTRYVQEKLAAKHGRERTPGGFSDVSLPEPGVATAKASRLFHDFTGFPEHPEGAEPTIAQTAGEFLSPVPGLSKFVNPIKHGVKAATKAAGRAAVESAGMSTALRELPNITDEGSVLEDIGKTIIGGATARGAINVGKTLASPKAALAKAASMGAEPNIKALKLAEKHGIELPVNVGMRSAPLNWTSNVLSNTVFASKNFKQVIQKANDSMMRAVKKATDRLGVKNIDPETASASVKEFVTAEEKAAKKIIKNEYDAAKALLKEGDTVVPKHTAEVIDSMKEVLERTIKSPETRAVTAHVLRIAKEWGLIPDNIKLGKDLEALADNPASMRKIIAALKKSPNAIPVQALEGVRTELGNILKHKQNVLGMEGWLQSLKTAVGKDLDIAGNQAYRNARKKAHATYIDVYANRFKESIAKSIITGDAPLYAYEQLKNVKNLRILEKIAGESPKARQIVDALKKAKVREIFNKALTEEGIHTGNFARIFESNEVKKGFLKELLGPESFKDMSELAKIMREMMNSGKELLNTSKTAYISADLATLKKFGIEVSTAIVSIFSLKSAGATIAATNLTSRLLADPEFIKMARAFAMARKNGNMAYSGRLLENMGKKANDILKATTYSVTKPQSKEEE